MHEESIYGIAAHWYYKSKHNNSGYQQPKWVNEIIEIQKEITNTSEFVKDIKMDIFRDRIFIFSPKGDVFELPEKSTPIDFAYAVHGNVGNKAAGVIINDKLGKLDQELKNGDLVEIIIEKNRLQPNKDWLKFVKTKRARDQIKQHAKKSTLDNIKRFIPGIHKK
jgi:GTP pyrophosphokinase